MPYSFQPLDPCHHQAVLEIFNHYIRHSMAAYAEDEIDAQGLMRLLEMLKGYPTAVVIAPQGQAVGFAFLRPIHHLPTFRRAAEIAYFIMPGHTGQGLGAALLQRLEDGARDMGIDTILASVSSHNHGSQRFHRRHGFEQAGRFIKVGRKHGQDFDVVWMQKRLA
jgi:phosphinothricin acetyltransferase